MGMNMSKLGFLAAKSGVITGLILSYVFFTDLRKVEYNLFDRKQPVQEYYYPNPPILSIDWNSNDDGKIETYIVNSESGKKIPILYDLLPDNQTLIDGVNQRMAEGYLSADDFLKNETFTVPSNNNSDTKKMLEEMIGYFEGVNNNGNKK